LAAPTDAPQPTTVPTTEPAAASAQTSQDYQSGTVDLDKIFPPGPGKDLILMGCTGCHSFVPLVIVRFNKEEWERNARDHRDRVSSMSDADFATVYAYLEANFGPDSTVPDLPQELLDQWTSY
jgi:hypothetical protein